MSQRDEQGHVPRLLRQLGTSLALAATLAPMAATYPSSAWAAEVATEIAAEEKVSPRTDTAIVRGLEFLIRNQNPDGSFMKDGPRIAITSLCVMSFLASGHVPGDGKYGQDVRRGIDYIVAAFPEDGYVGRVDNSRMYGQGIITMTLAEAYGVERDPARREKLRKVLEKAAKVILEAQKVQKAPEQAGGWRYEPGSGDSDLSLSGWNALALRACNNIGLAVPREAIDRAAAFVLRCYRADRKGFSYQPGQEPNPAMTGVGILNLCLMDAAGRKEVADASEYLAANRINEDSRFCYYNFYYTTHAAFQIGKSTWQKVWTANSEKLLTMQHDDGGWPQSRDTQEPGRMYATAMAVLTLSAPLKLVPVHQR